MASLENRTAVVTGAASGIGFATATTLCGAGARVILADINETAGKNAEQQLRSSNAGATFMPVDVADEASVRAMATSAVALHGSVDIVVNAAGWTTIAPFVETDAGLWRKIVEINFIGTLRVVHAFLPGMMERHAGKIVNVSSDAGRVGSTGESVYAGAKGGVIAFTKSLARETARFSINVNCVCPGPTDTPMLAAVRSERDRELFIRATPLHRLAKPSEIADAVLFFSGPQSDFITGQVLSVSGGLTMAG